ncbi:MAG TPA: M1 family metallopeptidase, partial [Gemmatimonadaceae bacterium]
RSLDGRPGPNYWENHGRYSIALTVMPPDRTVKGTEQISYANNSPDTLRNLVIKLFINIHKPGAPRDGGAAPDYLTSGTHIDAFSVNGQPVAWNDSPRTFTWQRVKLPAPLMPHDSVKLAFNWHYEISLEAGREGMLDSTTYYLAYFYPRVAVYDDYNGWDTMDFTDQQEFYSDFNDYDVSLSVPANYIVWGTGTLLNADDVLQPAALQRFKSSLTSDQVIHVATKEETAGDSITTQHPMNTWRFRASDIPDMAFAVSNHYDWDAASVIVDDATHRRASVQSAFNDTAADYHHMVHFARHALDWLSHNWPGVPYPYEKTTVVQGSADMEYPMMVNDGSTADTVFSRFVVEHELAHTYFPFYMGTDETRYGFMDEGWATTFEYLIGTADLGKDRASTFFQQFRVNGWIHDPSPLEDLPIVTPGDVLKGVAYGNNAYGKPALGYLAVKDLLGDATFKKALHAYMDRWHGKHPTPWDFFNTFNDASGKNLNWFWNNWYFSNNYIDLALTSVTRSGNGYSLVIDNIGGMAAPVDVRVQYTDGTSDTIHQTPAIWEADQKRATVRISTRKTVRSVDLDGGIWMDADTTNNKWTAK